MFNTTDPRGPERDGAARGPAPTDAPGGPADPLTTRVRGVSDRLAGLLNEAQRARLHRAEAQGSDGGTAVCAWNHFENIPTFYNWNNRPR
jgi:hypothetical protein